MKKTLILLVSLLSALPLVAQDFAWNLVKTYALKEANTWSVDGLENVFLATDRNVIKYDSLGREKFSQSTKALGPMSELVAINPLKLVYFSADQQTLCFLDNTLSQMDKPVELADLGIDNASDISESVQPNKIWIYDNLNSRLLLVPLDRVYQPQEVGNIRGMLGLQNVDEMKERNSRLLLLDKEKGVFMLDLYGSLLQHYPDSTIISVDANEQMLFLLRQNQLEIRPFDSDESYAIDLPTSGIQSFAYRNHFFYFQTAEAVYKFRLHFSE